MAVITSQPQHPAPLTPQQFEQMAALPENAHKNLEFIAGDVSEVASRNRMSKIGAHITGRLAVFVEDHDLGFVTGADGGYVIGHDRLIPDAAFVSKARQPVPSDETYNSTPPDLAVEVLSPSNTSGEMRYKIAAYLATGVTLWIVDPALRQVEVYGPGRRPRVYKPGDTLTGEPTLPGFTLEINRIFPEEQPPESDI